MGKKITILKARKNQRKRPLRRLSLPNLHQQQGEKEEDVGGEEETVWQKLQNRQDDGVAQEFKF